jgi:hypothetical protein
MKLLMNLMVVASVLSSCNHVPHSAVGASLPNNATSSIPLTLERISQCRSASHLQAIVKGHKMTKHMQMEFFRKACELKASLPPKEALKVYESLSFRQDCLNLIATRTANSEDILTYFLDFVRAQYQRDQLAILVLQLGYKDSFEQAMAILGDETKDPVLLLMNNCRSIVSSREKSHLVSAFQPFLNSPRYSENFKMILRQLSSWAQGKGTALDALKVRGPTPELVRLTELRFGNAAKTVLLKFLTHSDSKVVLAASKSLIALGDTSHGPLLSKRCKGMKDAKDVKDAFVCCAKMGMPEVLEKLLVRAKSAKDIPSLDRFRDGVSNMTLKPVTDELQAIELLENYPLDKVESSLTSLIKQSDSIMARARACLTLAEFDNQSHLPLIQAAEGKILASRESRAMADVREAISRLKSRGKKSAVAELCVIEYVDGQDRHIVLSDIGFTPSKSLHLEGSSVKTTSAAYVKLSAKLLRHVMFAYRINNGRSDIMVNGKRVNVVSLSWDFLRKHINTQE